MSHVLIVEDDHNYAESMMGALQDRGHDVVVCETLDSAHTVFALGDSFDFILCDYELPQYPGGLNTANSIEFLREVHTHSTRPKTVLMSGLDRTRELRQAGVEPDYIISKSDPIRVLDLLGEGE